MPTLGEKLKREREMRGVSLQEISAATRISERYLRAIEEDDYDAIPAPVFIQGFLRGYAGHIGIDSDKIIEEFGSLNIVKKEEVFQIKPLDLEDNNFSIIAAVVLIVLALIGYAIYANWPVEKQVEVKAVKVKTITEKPVKAAVESPATPAPASESPPAENVSTEKPDTETALTETAPEAGKTDTPDEKIKPEKPPPVEKEKKEDTQKIAALKETKPAPATPPKPVETVNKSKPLKQSKYRLIITATVKDAWILVVIDNKRVHDMFVRAGESIVMRAEESFEFTTGNAEHIKLNLNGQNISVKIPPSNVIRHWMLPLPEKE